MNRNRKKSVYIFQILLCVTAASLMLFMFTNFSETLGTPLKDFFTTDFYEETGARNAVAVIYLNYRMFDTFFEALMLMVSVMEVINVSWISSHSESFELKPPEMSYAGGSQIIAQMIGIVYPFVILIGFYMILNGHNSPGGGFQGGTILSTVLITRYLVHPTLDLDLEIIEVIEKIVFMLIIMIPILYLFIEIVPTTDLTNELYMIIMNTLIGLKVFCGLTVLFYRFVFYEGVS